MFAVAFGAELLDRDAPKEVEVVLMRKVARFVTFETREVDLLFGD